MPVADHKIKIALLQQVVLDAGEHQRRISFADLWHHHTNGKTPLRPQRARHEVRPVVQLTCRRPDALLGAQRDRLGGRRSINDEGHRSWRKPEIFGQKLQAHGLRGMASAWPGRCARLRTSHGVFNARSLAHRTWPGKRRSALTKCTEAYRQAASGADILFRGFTAFSLR